MITSISIRKIISKGEGWIIAEYKPIIEFGFKGSSCEGFAKPDDDFIGVITRMGCVKSKNFPASTTGGHWAHEMFIFYNGKIYNTLYPIPIRETSGEEKILGRKYLIGEADLTEEEKDALLEKASLMEK